MLYYNWNYANKIDSEIHKYADGKCVATKCANARDDYLTAADEYYRKVQEHDDAELDYEDYPVQDLPYRELLCIIAVREMLSAESRMQRALSRMEQFCSR